MDDVLVELRQPAGALGHELGLEGPVAIPWNVQVDGADLGQHRLRGGAVAVVARPTPGGIAALVAEVVGQRSEEHTSELQSLMRISYAVFCLKTKKHRKLYTRLFYIRQN